jgi:hypothetical protein
VLLDFFQQKRLRVERLKDAEGGAGAAVRAAAAIDMDEEGAGASQWGVGCSSKAGK